MKFCVQILFPLSASTHFLLLSKVACGQWESHLCCQILPSSSLLPPSSPYLACALYLSQPCNQALNQDGAVILCYGVTAHSATVALQPACQHHTLNSVPHFPSGSRQKLADSPRHPVMETCVSFHRPLPLPVTILSPLDYGSKLKQAYISGFI